MIHDVLVRITPESASRADDVKVAAAKKAGVKVKDINAWRITRRSVDARQRNIYVNLGVRLATGNDRDVIPDYKPVDFKPVPKDAPVLIIAGAGPAGLFAALECIRNGVRPVVVERGKDVDERRLDLAAISRTGRVDPDSNYCFGEGGAGAYSDGKLFTRSKKRGDVTEVLNLLHQHGANENILVDAHPHIGSDKLPTVIRNIRETIISCGGEVRFNERVSKLLIDPENGCVIGVETSKEETIFGALLLATGHSARDTFEMLRSAGIRMESKGIAVGVRLEHPSELIDRLQYHKAEGRGKYLPAAEYRFVSQAEGRGVYSFCMCPGGVVVPTSSAPGEQVVNGMSASARSSRWSNSGMVVEIHPGDIPGFEDAGEFEMLELQRSLERKFFETSGNSLNAPAQRMKDFVDRKMSSDLPRVSYSPGVHGGDFHKLLPPFISERLRQGFKDFDKKQRGFLTNDAVLIGLESRTSSPVRIPRDTVTLCHPDHPGLYPAGEGAGFAGGIVSAAMDGMKCAAAFCRNVCGK